MIKIKFKSESGRKNIKLKKESGRKNIKFKKEPGRKNVKGNLKKVLAILLSILASFAVLLTVTFFFIRHQGKRQFEKAAVNTAPKLVSKETDSVDDSLISEVEDDGIITYKQGRYRYNEDIVTILVMGIDSKDKIPSLDSVTNYTYGGQADALFLLVINPDDKKVSIVSVNRNALGEVDVYDTTGKFLYTETSQVCLAHGYGTGLEDSCIRETNTISKLFYYLPIHGYVSLQMGAISILNDAVGGIELELLEDIPRGSDTLRQGKGSKVLLSGDDAYHYVQYRDTKVFDSLASRMARQKQYLKLLVQKVVASTKKDLSFPLTLMGELKDYIVTDISASRITYLAATCIGYDVDLDNIYTLEGETVEGEDGYEEFIVDDDALYDLVIRLFYTKEE